MNFFIKWVILPICVPAMLSGCGANVLTSKKLNIFGTEPVVVKEPFQTIDLALILQPKIKLSDSLATTENNASEAKTRYVFGKRISKFQYRLYRK